MAQIDIEKFICDCIEMAEHSVTWEMISENIDGGIFKAALRKQGFVYKNGKIYKKGEEPEDPKPQFLVYDRANDKFEVTSEQPELRDGLESFMGVAGTNYLIRSGDYANLLARNIASIIKKE